MGLSQSSWCLESRTITVHFTLVLENLNSIKGVSRASPRVFGVWNQDPQLFTALVLENLNSLEAAALASPRAFGVWNQGP